MASAGQSEQADGSASVRPSVVFSINDPVRILVVGNDDEYEQVLRTTMGRLRLSSNVEAAFLHSVADARKAVLGARIDVVVSDFLLPDGTSADLVRTVKERSPDSQTVILTARPLEEFSVDPTAETREVWPKALSALELRRNMERLILMRALARSGVRRIP